MRAVRAVCLGKCYGNTYGHTHNQTRTFEREHYKTSSTAILCFIKFPFFPPRLSEPCKYLRLVEGGCKTAMKSGNIPYKPCESQ